MKHIRTNYRTVLASAVLGLCGMAPLSGYAAESNVYGWLGYFKPSFDDEMRAGWYKINTTTGEQTNVWLDKKLGMGGNYFYVGYVRDGKICGYYGNASTKMYLEFDLATGEPLTEKEFDVSGDNAYKNMLVGAYNKADDCVYGFSLNVDKTIDYVIKAPASDPMNFSIVRRMPSDYMMPVSCCFSSADNHLYGIDQYGDLIRMDVYGNFEVAGFFSQMSGESEPDIAWFESGMTYSPRDNAFIWNRHDVRYNTSFYRISADKDHKWTKLTDLPWQDQYVFMSSPDTDGSEAGPVAPGFVSCSFPDGAVDGSIVFRMPSKLADGSDAPASMTWTATDGESVQSGTAAPGDEVTVNYSGLNNGEHNFTFRAAAGGEQGASLVHNLWVGLDVPAAPENVLLEAAAGGYRLSWTAPDHGAHYGHMVPADLTYVVYLDGKQVGNATKECSVAVELPSDAATRQYAFQVYAVADREGKLVSEPGTSNSVFMGRGYDLPYTIVPDAEQAAAMTVINVDGDRSNWALTNEVGQNTPSFFTSRDWDNKGDDWLITPPLWFDKDNAKYNISFEVKFHNPLKAEEFYEVWVGDSPEADAMRQIRVAPKTRVNERTYYKVSYDFDVEKGGTRFAGIRYVGDADQGGIYVRNITVKCLDGGSGVETAQGAEVNATGHEGFIMLSAPESAKAFVYAADGRLVASPVVEGAITLQAERGLYVVKICDKSFKVFVK